MTDTPLFGTPWTQRSIVEPQGDGLRVWRDYHYASPLYYAAQYGPEGTRVGHWCPLEAAAGALAYAAREVEVIPT